jgi:hypothetical protein
VREQILRALTGERFAGIADCFMPDHLHLLVAGTSESSDLKQFVKSAKAEADAANRSRD